MYWAQSFQKHRAHEKIEIAIDENLFDIISAFFFFLDAEMSLLWIKFETSEY